jgi:peptidyl-prolyl cis-trans isomerase A (cyclophilin A)
MKSRRSSLVISALLLASPWILAACKQEAAPEPGVTTSTVTIPAAPPSASGFMAIASSSASNDKAGSFAIASASASASAAPVASLSASASAKPGASASATASAATKPGDGKFTPTQKTAAQLDPALAKGKAPDVFKAKFITTKGDFVLEVHRDWSPNGADRFYNLVKMGFYNETRFFRVVDGFMVQWGIHGDAAVNKVWQNNVFPDDPVKESNKRGFVSFATRGANSRTTQVFINFVDGNSRLDGMGFTPFAKVVDGMNVVDSLYKGYGEGAPRGQGPDQGRMQSEGNDYLKKDFDKLDWIKETKLL